MKMKKVSEKKNHPVEVIDDVLEQVSGGMGVAVEVTDSYQNAGVDGSSYAGGIAGYTSSGEIKNC